LRSTVTDTVAQTYQAALRLLAGRDYTVAVLVRKLEQRGHAPEQVAAAVARLVSERFLDDHRYGEGLIAQCRASGRYVGYRLRQELKRRGVPAEVVVELLADPQENGEELALARQLISRRYAGFDPVASDDRDRRRVVGFLQRRGFGAGVIRQLLDRRRQID